MSIFASYFFFFISMTVFILPAILWLLYYDGYHNFIFLISLTKCVTFVVVIIHLVTLKQTKKIVPKTKSRNQKLFENFHVKNAHKHTKTRKSWYLFESVLNIMHFQVLSYNVCKVHTVHNRKKIVIFSLVSIDRKKSAIYLHLHWNFSSFTELNSECPRAIAQIDSFSL